MGVCVVSDLVYADGLVLMCETIGGLWAFDSKGLKVSLGRMVSDGITEEGLSKSKADPCVFCSLRVKANSVLCVQCGNWIHDKCIRVKNVFVELWEKICLQEI